MQFDSLKVHEISVLIMFFNLKETKASHFYYTLLLAYCQDSKE